MLGEKIAEARRKAGLSQTDLARKLWELSEGSLRPSQSLISDWECGRKRPSPLSLALLVKALPELGEIPLRELTETA